jgi:hypothetical protein
MAEKNTAENRSVETTILNDLWRTEGGVNLVIMDFMIATFASGEN